ncbi:MAG: hypothetical protein OXH22_05135 [Chloroflexi bacterium]|nr:hypothetical protein [Chloroflexota bacterium]
MTTIEERLSHLEGGYNHLATKADVQTLETRMTQQIAESEARSAKQRADMETRLTKQIAESETRMVKWMVGALTGGIVAGAAIVTAVVNIVG